MFVEWSAELVDSGPDHATLAIRGELDIATAPRLRKAIAAVLGQGARHVELDLSGVTFLDSSGIGVLLWAERRLEAAGGRLRATGARGDAAQVLEVAGVAAVVAARG